MTDTPDHIKKIQLKIWLAKSPAERLKQFLLDNEAFYLMTRSVNNIKSNTARSSPQRRNEK